MDVKTVLCAAFLLSGFFAFSEEVNLLSNGGFEQVKNKGDKNVPMGWKWSCWGSPGKIEVVEDIVKEGKRAIRISKSGFKGAAIITSDIAVPAHIAQVKLSFWWKTERVVGPPTAFYKKRRKNDYRTFRGIIDFLGKDNKKTSSHSMVFALGTNPWTYAQETIDLPAGTTSLKVMIGLFYCSGTVWVDDAKLTVSGKREQKVLKTDGVYEGDLLADEKADYDYLQQSFDKGKIEYARKRAKIVINSVPEYPQVLGTYDGPQTSSCRNIVVRGNNIYRKNKPTFLFGDRGDDHNYKSPMLHRILGFDYTTIGTNLRRRQKVEVKNGKTEDDKIVEVTYHTSNYGHLAAREWLRCGFSLYGGFGEKRSSGNTQMIEKYFPELFMAVNNHHYVSYCHTNPLARRLRREIWKSEIASNGYFPVFVRELLNECCYYTETPTAQKLFREAMKAKYGTIELANRAWGSSYSGFDKIVFPNHTINANNYPKYIPKELYYEHIKWQEENFGDMVEQMCRDARRMFPGIKLTLQSHVGHLKWHVGVIPPQNARGVDIYGDESAGGASTLRAGSSSETVKENLPFQEDVVRAAASHIPIIDEEGGYSLESDSLASAIQTPFVNLHTTWKFKDDKNNVGDKENWQAATYNDNEWDTIEVPGVWGQLGFPQCKTGWYRIKVKVPATNNRVYLVAQMVCDDAWAWVNGKPIHSPNKNKWDEGWNIDITDMLDENRNAVIVVKVFNNFFRDNMYWGGIRGAITITNRRIGGTTTGKITYVSREHGRSLAWSRVIHGYSGWSCWQWAYKKILRERSLCGFADFKHDLKMLADIVGPRPRIRAMAGLYFSYADFRTLLYKNFAEMKRSPWNSSVRDAYYALFASHIPVDILQDKQIQNDKLDKYRMLVFHAASRIPSGTIEHLEKWVKKGGVLIVTYGSLVFDDDLHKKILTPPFLGVKPGRMRTEPQTLTFNGNVLPSMESTQRMYDKTTGVRIRELNSNAKSLASFVDGTPAITEMPYGQGYVYYVGVSLRLDDMAKLFNWIASKNSIQGPLCVEKANGAPAPHVEVQRLGSGQRRIWYLMNCENKTQRVKVAANDPQEGKWRVRSVRTGTSPIASRKIWSASDLRKGFRVDLPPYATRMFLVESDNVTALPIRPLSGPVKRFLERYENLSARNPAKPKARVLIHIYGRLRAATMPTSIWLLQDFGYEVNQHYNSPITGGITTYIGDEFKKETLKDYDVVILAGSPGYTKFAQKEALQRTLADYVRAGGNLLFCGSPRVEKAGNKTKTLERELGISLGRSVLRHPSPYTFEKYYIAYSVKGTHPILRGVNKFFGSGEGTIAMNDKDGVVLFNTAPGTFGIHNKSRPMMIAKQVGKGKVVVINGSRWLRPDDMWRGDNARLLLNAVDWLAGIERKEVDEKKLRRAVDWRDALLAVDPEINWAKANNKK